MRKQVPDMACVLPEVLRMMHQTPTRVVWSDVTGRPKETRGARKQKEKERGGEPCCP